MHAGNGLLPPVTPLVQVHRTHLIRRPDPVHLMRDRAVIGVDAQSGSQSGDPKSFVSPRTCRAHADRGQARPPRDQLVGRDDQVDGLDGGMLTESRHHPPEPAVGQRPGVVDRCRRGYAEQLCDGTCTGLRPQQAQYRHVRARGDLDLRPEDHLRQERGQRLAAMRLGVDPRGAVEVGLDEVIFDPAVPVEAEVLRAASVREVGDELTGDGVEPAEPLVAGEGDDAAMRTVDHHRRGGRSTLLTERVTEVPRHCFVWGIFRATDCA